MSVNKEKLKSLLDAVRRDQLNLAEQEMLVHALLAEFNRTKDLGALLNTSPDRAACNTRINAAVELVRGPGYGFSGHGILKTLGTRYTEEQKAVIVRKLYEFGCLLRDGLDIQSFITSGTLLGLIREGRFLPHDDDFDMAYVSRYAEKDDIVAERLRIFDLVNASADFVMKERTGGRAAIFVTCPEVDFIFDLFAGYAKDGYFNEFPLQPNTLSVDEIVPVQTAQFYGQDIWVPKSPEKLLALNYGEGWKVPDPGFRFNFGEHRGHYHFLIKNKFEDLVELK